MKLLKIEDNKGYFKTDESLDWQPLDLITKDSILTMLHYILNNDEIDMDQFEDEIVQNQAHNIIYNNLFSKFQEVISEKNNIIDRTNQLFQESIDKYNNINT
ncbi:conserved hypothetical protein [Carnobacterium maltaromaticum]|uniref:hypothetical protein n=1 Tax=Carnobacterium maltaromaticum TaxID=2751 RepID=UPI00191BAD1F|nr:hypothetical protein [Carnobacterium maltaromaticum]CAD5902354.1 conserved hypothetical protein [Carnobacterium maltaromaticum]